MDSQLKELLSDKVDIMSNEKQQIIQDINNLDNEKLKILKKCIDKLNNENNNKKTVKLIEKPKKDIDRTTEKYKLLLKYVNGILKNINKNNIDDLYDFKDIDRLDIIKKENIKLLDTMAPILFKHFNKDKCGYYRKTKNIALNCLRGMCKELGVELKKRQFTKSIKSRNITHLAYSII